LERIIALLCRRVGDILKGEPFSVYIYGSYVLSDMRPGWSDIDVLILTENPLSQTRTEALLSLRQRLYAETGDERCLAFEGGITDISSLTLGGDNLSVYWGTGKERLTKGYAPDVFAMHQLFSSGRLVFGSDVREYLPRPGREDILEGVLRHYGTIRKYVTETKRSLYSFGWMLDISRCLYTLKKGGLICKTKAALWALEEGLCPVPDALFAALEVRRDTALINVEKYAVLSENMAPFIQRYADVLGTELEKFKQPKRLTVGDDLPVTSRKYRCRGIVCREGKYLITDQQKVGYCLLPGGGIEPGESPEECIVREVSEEAGLIAEIGLPYLVLTERYGGEETVSRFYSVQIKGTCEKLLTESEIEKGTVTRWVDKAELTNIFGSYGDYAHTNEDKYRVYLREYTGIKAFFDTEGESL